MICRELVASVVIATAVPTMAIDLGGGFNLSGGASLVSDYRYRGGDYLDWSLGTEAAFGPVTTGVAFVESDHAAAHGVKSALVFSIGAAI